MKKLFLSFITILSIGIGLARAYQTYTINGIPYQFPDVNDETWGQSVTDWAGAVTNGMLQKAGGTFTLTAEAYFGANYGIRAAYFKSKNLPAASTGTIRLANADTIRWRNINNTGDFTFQVNSSSLPVFNGYVLGFSTDISNVIFLSTTALQSNIDALYVNVSSTYTSLVAAINSTNTYAITEFVNVANSTAGITTRADLVAVATTSFYSRLNDLDLSTANITTRANAAAISTTTANARLNNLDQSTVNITNRADAVAITTSANTTRLNNLDLSTANITTRADAVAIATTALTVQKISIYSAGVFAGNVSTINFNTNLTVSVTGGTATINATGTGGGGSSSYQFTIGTSSARGANYVGNTQAVFNTAIADALLALGTTDAVTIFVQRGSYTFTSEVFVPARIVIKGEDQEAIVSNNNGLGLFYVEGRITDMGFRVVAWSYSGSGINHIIAMGYKGLFDKNKFYSINGNNGGTATNCIFLINNSSLSVITGNILDNVFERNFATFEFAGTCSSNTVSYNEYKAILNVGNNGYVVSFRQGLNNEVSNNKFTISIANAFMAVADASSGKMTFRYVNNYVNIDVSNQGPNGICLFQTGGAAGDIVSTGTIISGNIFFNRGADTANPWMAFYLNNLGDVDGALFFNNTFTSNGGVCAGMFFYTSANAVKHTIWQNNSVFNTSYFVSESGVNQLYTGKNNTWNGVNQ